MTKPYTTKSPLVAFLYEVLRDHVTVGVLQKIINDQHRGPGEVIDPINEAWRLTDGDLAKIAQRMVDELNTQGKPYARTLSTTGSKL